MSFLYITNRFPPELNPSSIRAYEFSKRLIENKIFPIILTKKIQKNISSNNFSISKDKLPLTVYRTPFIEINNKYLMSIIKSYFRVFFYFEWVPFAYLVAKRYLRNHKNIKFIYASAPSFYTHVIGYFLKKKFNLPLVVEYRDIWSFNPYYESKDKWYINKIHSFVEKKVLQSSDLIITVSSALKLYLKKKFEFIRYKPIFSISNGLNLQDQKDLYKKNPHQIVFTFTGSIYGKRSISPLLKIISSLKKENYFKEFAFMLKIFGHYNQGHLHNIIKKLNIEDLVFLGGLIPKSKAIYEIIKSDLAVHIGENFNYPTIAFKVWDYLSCRKKILYLGREDSYTAVFLMRNKLGIVIPLDNPSKGKEMLKNLLKNMKRNVFENHIDERKIIKYSWDNKVNKFTEYIYKKFT